MCPNHYSSGRWWMEQTLAQALLQCGVGIIVGKETGKLLYICIYVYKCTKLVLCCMFSQYSHICFRKWSNSSSEMESDIILPRIHGS